MTPDFNQLLDALLNEEVAFVIVGGVALVLYGSARVTWDLDICYARGGDNLQRLAKALQPFEPSLRGAPKGLPFQLDAATLRAGLNFTLSTAAGDIDLLGEVAGVGDYAAVREGAESVGWRGRTVLLIGLDSLERAKIAAGRLKDVLDVAELRAIRTRRGPAG